MFHRTSDRVSDLARDSQLACSIAESPSQALCFFLTSVLSLCNSILLQRGYCFKIEGVVKVSNIKARWLHSLPVILRMAYIQTEYKSTQRSREPTIPSMSVLVFHSCCNSHLQQPPFTRPQFWRQEVQHQNHWAKIKAVSLPPEAL